MVRGYVRLLEDRRELILVRSDLVMPGHDRYSELIGFLGHLKHVIDDPLFDRAEILVFELLSFRRRRAD